MAADDAAGAGSAIARGEALLRGFVDRRPSSGRRSRPARACGEHARFVTRRRASSMVAYAADPERARRALGGLKRPHELEIGLAAFGSAETARSVETLILDFATPLIMLEWRVETSWADHDPRDQERTP